jgi:hypothetical protein
MSNWTPTFTPRSAEVVRTVNRNVTIQTIFSTYKVEANNSAILPASEEFDTAAGSALEVYELPTFSFDNRLIDSIGMSASRTELLGRLEFKPCYDEEMNLTSFGELWDLRLQVLALAHENVETAETTIAEFYNQEHASLLTNATTVFEEAITQINDITALTKIIDDTALGHSLRLVESSTLPTPLEKLDFDDTIHIFQAEDGDDILSYLYIDDSWAQIFSETKLIGQVWSDLKSSILHYTPSFGLVDSPGAESFPYYVAAGSDVKLNASRASIFESYINSQTFTSMRDLATDKVGAVPDEDSHGSLFSSHAFFGAEDNLDKQIKYLSLCISRELVTSACSNALTSEFGVEDYQTLDFMIGTFAEPGEDTGATSIFDLSAQPGGSVGDYLHATSSLSDGTELNVLPFESRKFSHNGTAYLSGFEFVRQVVTEDVAFDSENYTDWVTDYTDRAKATIEYLVKVLALDQYGSGVFPVDSNEFVAEMEGEGVYDSDMWSPGCSSEVLRSVLKILNNAVDNVNSDGLGFITLALISQQDDAVAFHVQNLLKHILLSDANSQTMESDEGEEFAIVDAEMRKSMTDTYTAVTDFVQANMDSDSQQLVLRSDDHDFEVSSVGLFISSDNPGESEANSDHASYSSDRDRERWRSNTMADGLEAISFKSIFSQLLADIWQANADAGGAAASAAEAIFDSASLVANGSEYAVDYTIYETNEHGLETDTMSQDQAEAANAKYVVNYDDPFSLLNYPYTGARTKFRKISFEHILALYWKLICVVTDSLCDFSIGLEYHTSSEVYIYSSTQEVVKESDLPDFNDVTMEESGDLVASGDANQDDGTGMVQSEMSCFIAGTKISVMTAKGMAYRNIEDISIGDMVLTSAGIHPVIRLDPTVLGTRKLYSFNGTENYFVTSEHPFMTLEGWKSIKPEMTKLRDGIALYNQLAGTLVVGDKLVTEHGLTEIESITSIECNSPEMPLYNFHVDIAHEYYADGYLVHNKTVVAGNGVDFEQLDKAMEMMETIQSFEPMGLP